ncbi:serine/threonine protein kinase [Paenarthrobacter nitroguajacolicus]|uniref:serine/threonine-protein kinase n=1 Tax=Paenarthrobacter nitroguajacolicus TaxID=211146 RepID=UPI002865589B|nr:protein kinase [Paenarthrobacter nitroguajacolicus]MDR6988336.1 serine/threonine protein kinase [Paenarthrobacter nitroguajacolicus]
MPEGRDIFVGNNDEAVDSRVPDSIDDTLDGRYQLGPVLGRGAMSAVYRATDLLLGRDVAIKIFLPGSGDDSFRARQKNEMRLLAAFDHPGLVAALDAGVDTRNDEERAYLVMELAEGRDLRAVLTEGPLTIPETARIGIRLAGALSQVHAHGVIHRDIKPANILVSDDDGLGQSVKLADFGVALVMDDNRLTATGFTVGTAQYLSPEQAQGLALTPASDIYSLGLVLLECLTGRAEYPGTPIETASARLHRAPQIPVELPAPLRSLLEAMTDMDPQKRPAAHDVEKSLAEEGIQSGRRTAVLPPVPSRTPLRAATRKQATVTSIRTFTKRRPKTVRGVAAAAVTIPLALLIFSQGINPTGNNTADPSQPADSGISQAEPQPSVPDVPAAPVGPAPAEAVPAEVVNLPETTQPEQLPAPAVQPPAIQAPVVEAPVTGKDVVDKKGEGKTDKKPAKDRHNEAGK